MAFSGPHTDDFRNVVSLNRACLDLLRQDESLSGAMRDLDDASRAKIRALDESAADRLAATPFLLLSFRERDDVYWDRLLDDLPGRDLFAADQSEALQTLIAASVSFIWQLANRNPYALRLICGSTLYWCERIADLTCLRLLEAVRSRSDLPVLRFASHHHLWRKLLGNGTSRDYPLRNATHISALQMVLTEAPERAGATWPVAARSLKSPGLRVADRN